jgi:hypothetical protein
MKKNIYRERRLFPYFTENIYETEVRGVPVRILSADSLTE